MNEDRIVLFPYGQPVDRDKRDACLALVIHAGGDLNRILDGPWDSDPGCAAAEAGFLRYVSRIQEVVNGIRPPLVVLTRSNPLSLAVIAKRRRICAAIKNLDRAAWIVFVDPVTDPFFCHNADQLGAFDVARQGESDEAMFAVWTPEDARRNAASEQYAIWHPQTARDEFFKARMAEFWHDAEQVPIASVTQAKMRALTDLDEPVPSKRRRY